MVNSRAQRGELPQPALQVRRLGRVPYTPTLERMRRFTLERRATTLDEIWLLEHERVFTQGQAGKAEHVLAPGDIPVVPVDRGGQVTYHGPGQLVAYTLLDIRRLGLGVRQLVSHLEGSVVDLLAGYGVDSHARADAPGVYVGAAKIAALGLRIKRGCSYHGLALNLDLDLEPFARINPCGHEGLAVTRVCDTGAGRVPRDELTDKWLQGLSARLGYTRVIQ